MTTVLLGAVHLPAASHQADHICIFVVLGVFPDLGFDAPNAVKSCLLIVSVD